MDAWIALMLVLMIAASLGFFYLVMHHVKIIMVNLNHMFTVARESVLKSSTLRILRGAYFALTAVIIICMCISFIAFI